MSLWHEEITRALLDGALEALRGAGVPDDRITVSWAAGSFELPIVAQSLAAVGGYSGIVAIGCVIRGDTTHHEHIGSAATHGLVRVSLDAHIPVGFGVLTCDTFEQAWARAVPGDGNKGAQAACAVLETISLLRQVGLPGACA